MNAEKVMGVSSGNGRNIQTKTIKTVMMSELRRINGSPAQQRIEEIFTLTVLYRSEIL